MCFGLVYNRRFLKISKAKSLRRYFRICRLIRLIQNREFSSLISVINFTGTFKISLDLKQNRIVNMFSEILDKLAAQNSSFDSFESLSWILELPSYARIASSATRIFNLRLFLMIERIWPYFDPFLTFENKTYKSLKRVKTGSFSLKILSDCRFTG